MGVGQSNKEGDHTVADISNPIIWGELEKFIHAKEYDAVELILNNICQDVARIKNEQMMAVVRAAREICLSCSQIHAEMVLHQQAYSCAISREKKLQKELLSILDALFNLVSITSEAVVWCSEEVLLPATKKKNWTAHPIWQQLRRLVGKQQNLLTDANIRATLPEDAGFIESSLQRQPRNEDDPCFVVYLLGPFQVYQNNHLLTEWPSLKAQAIFKYLIIFHNKPVAKELLMDTFWPQMDTVAARRNLHQAVYALRQILRKQDESYPHILYEQDSYRLNPDMALWIDVLEFEQQIKLGQHMEAVGKQAESIKLFGIAEGLYRDDFLVEDQYEEWTIPQRRRLQMLYLVVMDRLASYYFDRQEFSVAIAMTRKIIEKECFNEAAHLRLMRCYVAQGQKNLAIQQYQHCQRCLKSELDVELSAETTAFYKKAIML